MDADDEANAQPTRDLPIWRPGGELRPLEERMCAAAAAGDPADGGEGPFDSDSMQTWSEERMVRASVLRYLLTDEAWRTDARGVQLRGVRINGRLRLETATLRCPLHLEYCYLDADDPACSLDNANAQVVTLRGCYLAGLTASMLAARNLDLGDSIFTGPLVLQSADIAGQLNCGGVRLLGCDKSGVALVTDKITVGGGVFLNAGFTAVGSVRLHSADIAGQLDCSGARLLGQDDHGSALAAEGMQVSGSVILNEVHTAFGAVDLVAADIKGQLICNGAELCGSDQSGSAVAADGMTVGGGVMLVETAAAGTIRLVGADINLVLNCRGARLTAAGDEGGRLVADGIRVSGNVFLDENFTAGEVSLGGANITGQLGCGRARLTGRAETGYALFANGMTVGEEAFLNVGFSAAGMISLTSARVGALVWAPGEQLSGLVNLESAAAGRLEDEWNPESSPANGYWPVGGRLRLNGFTYDRIGGDNQATVEQRLAWIRSQYHLADGRWSGFTTQPYEQLAAVYRQAGQDTDARKVAIARRADARRYGNLNSHRKAANWVLDKTIRYGYETWRAAAGLAAIYVIVLVLSVFAQHHNAIVPVGDIAGRHPVPAATRCASDYPCFYPAGYAIDTVVPIINVHQAENWAPDGHAQWGWAWVTGTWIATGLGWALVTLLVAGYTGLARQQ